MSHRWQCEVVFFCYLENFLYFITSDYARFYEIKNLRRPLVGIVGLTPLYLQLTRRALLTQFILYLCKLLGITLSPSWNPNYLEYEKMRALKARETKGRFPCPVIFYFLARSSSIATAGSTLPSTNSRNAPPPVEM